MKRLAILLIIVNCAFSIVHSQIVRCGADRIDQYLPLLKEKRVGVLAHKASYIYTGVFKKIDKMCVAIQVVTTNIFFLKNTSIDITCFVS